MTAEREKKETSNWDGARGGNFHIEVEETHEVKDAESVERESSLSKKLY